MWSEVKSLFGEGRYEAFDLMNRPIGGSIKVCIMGKLEIKCV